MKIRRDLLTAAVLLPMLLTVGCAGGDGSTSRTKSYQNDGYLGMESQEASGQPGDDVVDEAIKLFGQDLVVIKE